MAKNVRKLIREGKMVAKEHVKCRVCLDTGVAWKMGGVVGFTRFCGCQKGHVARGEFVARMKETVEAMNKRVLSAVRIKPEPVMPTGA